MLNDPEYVPQLGDVLLTGYPNSGYFASQAEETSHSRSRAPTRPPTSVGQPNDEGSVPT